MESYLLCRAGLCDSECTVFWIYENPNDNEFKALCFYKDHDTPNFRHVYWFKVSKEEYEILEIIGI
jgi:hypothetical protein